jgi:uncharacterized protein YjiS (DUF1127 family)
MRAGLTISSFGRSGLLGRGRQRGARVARGNILTLALAIVETWRQRRQLQQLEPRMLKDLGLSPDEVFREARRPIWDLPRH